MYACRRSAVGLRHGVQLGYQLRDLATHHVHGIASNPASWASRVKYTSGFRAVLAAFLVASAAPVTKVQDKAREKEEAKQDEKVMQSTTSQAAAPTAAAAPTSAAAAAATAAATAAAAAASISFARALPSAAMSQHHVTLMTKFASCKGNKKRRPEFGVWAAGVFAKARQAAQPFASNPDGGGSGGGSDSTRIGGGGTFSSGGSGGSFCSNSGDDEGNIKEVVSSPTPSAAELQQYFVNNSSDLIARQMFALEAVAAVVWPVIESLIILDRALFLVESADVSTVQVRPLFNPADSPRNFCLIASRGTTGAHT